MLKTYDTVCSTPEIEMFLGCHCKYTSISRVELKFLIKSTSTNLPIYSRPSIHIHVQNFIKFWPNSHQDSLTSVSMPHLHTQWPSRYLTFQIILRFEESLFLPPGIPGSLYKSWRVGVRHRACDIYNKVKHSWVERHSRIETSISSLIWKLFKIFPYVVKQNEALTCGPSRESLLGY